MATVPDPSIDELDRQSTRLEAEARKLMAEAIKVRAERALNEARRPALALDRSFWWFMMQITALSVALMGIGFGIVALGSVRG